jgi:hypothetical protein
MINILEKDRKLLKLEGSYKITYWLAMFLLALGVAFLIYAIYPLCRNGNLNDFKIKENVDRVLQLVQVFVGLMLIPFLIALLAESKLSHIKTIKTYTKESES